MSSYYCPPDIITLPALANDGFALDVSVVSIDGDTRKIVATIKAIWGAALPLQLANAQTPLALNQPFVFQIEDIPWDSLGNFPVRMLQASKALSEVVVGQTVVLATHVPSAGLPCNDAQQKALSPMYDLSFEILPSDAHQRWKLGLFFTQDGVRQWQDSASFENLFAELADPDLREWAFDAMHRRGLLSADAVFSLEPALLRDVLQRIEARFSAQEWAVLLADVGQYCAQNWSGPVFEKVYDWLRDLLLNHHVTLAQALVVIQPLSVQLPEHRRYISLFIDHILWLIEKDYFVDEASQSQALLDLIVQYSSNREESCNFEHYDFGKYFQSLSVSLQQSLLLQLGAQLNSNRRARDSDSKVDLDLLYFVLKQVALNPFVTFVPVLGQIDIGAVVPLQDRVETRVSMMRAGLSLSECFAQTQADVIRIIHPMIADETVFQPGVIVSFGPESTGEIRQRWDSTLARFKRLIED